MSAYTIGCLTIALAVVGMLVLSATRTWREMKARLREEARREGYAQCARENLAVFDAIGATMIERPKGALPMIHGAGDVNGLPGLLSDSKNLALVIVRANHAAARLRAALPTHAN